MVELRVGCSSWTSEAWWDRLYLRTISDGERLGWYARLFDTVEVDSTYYRAPARGMVASWRDRTPPEFLFTLKLPRDLLDPKVPVDREALAAFLTSAKLLGPKLGPVLLQFPPWVRPGRARESLKELLDALDPAIRYSIELRDRGWFEGETRSWLLEELTSRNMALTWSFLTYVEIPAEVTSDFIYLRFIGDHTTVPAEQHGEVRVDRSAETRRWAERLRQRQDALRASFVFFNNHYAGFAPASVNEFRVAMGLEPVDIGRYARGAQRLEDAVGPEHP